MTQSRRRVETRRGTLRACATRTAEGCKAEYREAHAGIALAFRGDAFRVVYAVQLAEEVWVVHAFQKKSTQGIKTPKREIDLIKNRLKRLKEMLR